MKVIQYLQKVGALPEYSKWNLLMSLVTIVNSEFSLETAIEPDSLQWVSKSFSEEEFQERCNIALFATCGDVKAMFPHICNKSESFLKELIETLLEIKVTMHSLSKAKKYDPSQERDFTHLYNDMLGLKGRKAFPSRSSILHFFFTDSLLEEGQKVLTEKIGTQNKFLQEVTEMQSSFLRMATQDFNFSLGEIFYEEEKDNPYEGGYQVRVRLIPPSEGTSEECTLHWAPWPTAKTKSSNQSVLELCYRFNASGYDGWVEGLYKE